MANSDHKTTSQTKITTLPCHKTREKFGQKSSFEISRVCTKLYFVSCLTLTTTLTAEVVLHEARH